MKITFLVAFFLELISSILGYEVTLALVSISVTHWRVLPILYSGLSKIQNLLEDVELWYFVDKVTPHTNPKDLVEHVRKIG